MNDIYVSISRKGGLTVNFDRNAEIDFILSEAVSVINIINTLTTTDERGILKFNKYATDCFSKCCGYNVDSSMINFLMNKIKIIHEFQAEVVAMNPPTLYLFTHSGRNGKNPLHLLKIAVDMIINLSCNEETDFTLTPDFKDELMEVNSDFSKFTKNS